MKTITFAVKRVTRGATNIEDVKAFIQEHQKDRHNLTVQIDPAGPGDAFADYLESAGFTVTRNYQG